MCFKYCYRGSKTNVLCINNKETAVMFLSILTAPPSAPTITSLISNSDQLTVTWTSVPTATSYNVSINDSVNTLVPIPSTGAPQYTFTGLTSNTVYTVSVVAINCVGSSSALASIRTGRCASIGNLMSINTFIMLFLKPTMAMESLTFIHIVLPSSF